MERWLLFFAFYVLFFSNLENYATLFQVSGASLTVLAAFVAGASKKVVGRPLSLGELLVLVMAGFSVLTALCRMDPDTIAYTIAFSLTFFAIAILVRTLNLNSTIEVSAYAYIAAIVTIFATNSYEFFLGLSGQIVPGVGLLRFRPLNLHPNLTGFIFGAGSIMLFMVGSTCLGYRRVIFHLFSGLSLTFVIAASARAGLLALVVSLLVLSFFRMRMRIQARITASVVVYSFVSLAVLGTMLANFDSLIGYAIRILDLANPLRGLESGGTGRTALWRMSVEELATRNTLEIVFGTGVRSSSAERIGYSTESSYFTILLENGIVLGPLFFFFVLLQAVRSSLLSRIGGDHLHRIVAALLFFALTQSIFNRYLLAIGNPFSLLLIFFFFHLSTNPRTLGISDPLRERREDHQLSP